MSGNILIIAPTHGYKRPPLFKTIDDDIKDNPDATRTHQNINGMITPGTVHADARVNTGKIYFDDRARKAMEQHQEDRGEQIFFMDDLYAHHPMKNISLPDVTGTNSKFIQGLSKL